MKFKIEDVVLVKMTITAIGDTYIGIQDQAGDGMYVKPYEIVALVERKPKKEKVYYPADSDWATIGDRDIPAVPFYDWTGNEKFPKSMAQMQGWEVFSLPNTVRKVKILFANGDEDVGLFSEGYWYHMHTVATGEHLDVVAWRE